MKHLWTAITVGQLTQIIIAILLCVIWRELYQEVAVAFLPQPATYHELGKLDSLNVAVRERLRNADLQQKQDFLAVVNVVAPLGGKYQLVQSPPNSKRARKGPFCRITCSGCHGGEWDAEVAPELCRANWIPSYAIAVPSWHAISDTEEQTVFWAGPARPGFEHYKLYWSTVQSSAREIHPSADER